METIKVHKSLQNCPRGANVVILTTVVCFFYYTIICFPFIIVKVEKIRSQSFTDPVNLERSLHGFHGVVLFYSTSRLEWCHHFVNG